MKYILLIIAVYTLAACSSSSSDSDAEGQQETALEAAGLMPQSEAINLLVPSTDELPKELFVPKLN